MPFRVVKRQPSSDRENTHALAYPPTQRKNETCSTHCGLRCHIRFMQELYLGSVLLMDPMSLLDYPEIDSGGDVLIVVEGEMSEETKK